jgi:hypothetical protein
MLKEQFVDGKHIFRLTGEATNTEYVLSTGSRMVVSMCIDCKNALKNTDEEYERVMESVILGWEIESSDLVASKSKPHWTPRVKDDYMESNRKKEIVTRSEGLAPDVVMERLGKFKSRKKKDKKKDK